MRIEGSNPSLSAIQILGEIQKTQNPWFFEHNRHFRFWFWFSTSGCLIFSSILARPFRAKKFQNEVLVGQLGKNVHHPKKDDQACA